MRLLFKNISINMLSPAMLPSTSHACVPKSWFNLLTHVLNGKIIHRKIQSVNLLYHIIMLSCHFSSEQRQNLQANSCIFRRDAVINSSPPLSKDIRNIWDYKISEKYLPA